MFGVSAVFSEYGEHLEAETEKKEGLKVIIKELEQTGRDLYTFLQRVHRFEPLIIVWTLLCSSGLVG